MAYDRYESRRDWREGRPRWRDDERSGNGWNERGDRSFPPSRDRDRFGDDRGFFERAGDEIASWFGDDEAERRRRRDNPERFSGHLRNEDDVRSYYDRERGAERRGWFGSQSREPERDHGDRFNRGSGESAGFGAGRSDRSDRSDRAFMSDDDFMRYERSPRWRDEGYRRPYTGRVSGGSDFGGSERGEQPYRPLTGDYGRGFEERVERGGSFYGVGAPHDRHYGQMRQRHLDELDRDYEDYARENRSRFEDDFSSWRQTRQQKRGLLGQVREQMEVVGSDGEHVGKVDRTAGDRLILAKSDEDAGGVHHSLMCTSIDRVEGDKVFLDMKAEDAKQRWRDESRDRALFERDDQGEAGPHMLNRSFSGTY